MPILLTAVFLIFGAPILSQDAVAPTTQGSRLEGVYEALLADARVERALAQIRDDHPRTVREQIEITEIAAPGGREGRRAADYVHRLRALGLTDASVDSEGNVIGRRPGARGAPTLVLSAHLDTVFSDKVDVSVRKRGSRFFGPGIGDDARGLAVVLEVARVLERAEIRTGGNLLIVGTVGEEGLGNLRGVKALFRDHPEIDGLISVDALDQVSEDGSARGEIISQAIGSRRWIITFKAPGGHSFHDFGLPSAIHAMGRAIARIADLRPDAAAMSTFTVGLVSGGTAINAISAESQMQVDARSASAHGLAALERQILAAADQAVSEENARWGSNGVSLRRELVGDRPAANGPSESVVVQAALHAARALNRPTPLLVAGSGDSNVPLALGVPAATLSGGGIGGGTHSLDEWYEPAEAWLGAQSVLLTTLALIGVEGGVSAPVLRPAVRHADSR